MFRVFPITEFVSVNICTRVMNIVAECEKRVTCSISPLLDMVRRVENGDPGDLVTTLSVVPFDPEMTRFLAILYHEP